MAITKEFVQNVRGRLEAEPGISTARLAVELGAREVDVITSMPVQMRKKARPQDFDSILQELGTLAPLPPTAISENDLGYIWFVSRPGEHGKRQSVRFFDKQGGHLFSIQLQGDSGEMAYARMTERFGVTPVPRRIACAGCGKCRCRSGRKHQHRCQ